MSLDHTPSQAPGPLLISFEDERTPRDTIAINSDYGFPHMNQDEAVSYSFPTTNGGPVEDCPCVLDTACEEKCCVETIREHRERLARVQNSFNPQAEDRNSLSSYGSMDDMSSGHPLRSPVASVRGMGGMGMAGGEEEEEEDSSTSPLIKPRHLVSDCRHEISQIQHIVCARN